VNRAARLAGLGGIANGGLGKCTCASESAEVSQWAESASAGVSPEALIALIDKRLSLGVNVAAAKFVSGGQIEDPARKKENAGLGGEWTARRRRRARGPRGVLPRSDRG